MRASPARRQVSVLRFAVPFAFVLIWSTGFIVAKAVVPHADLQFFLIVRFGLSAVVFAALAFAAKVDWPRRSEIGQHLVAGALMQGGYICLSYWAITHGLPAGIMALLGALQPLFTALYLVTVTRTQLATRTWLGLIIGFGGVALVLAPKIMNTSTDSLRWTVLLAALLSVVSITAGTLLQRSFANTDLRSAGCVQNLGAGVVAVAFTLLTQATKWDHSVFLWIALSWAVLAPSVVAATLLMWMVRHGEATKATALLLLVPPLAAIQAYFFFAEKLVDIQFAGFVLALAGVMLARSAPARTQTQQVAR